mmetsp:Transcript_19415/g.23219  ORF Transcript_19415/g.23219 Transcript_19415/m.23219 type:complete len:221 (-) Transcript_19415:288-950(-)
MVHASSSGKLVPIKQSQASVNASKVPCTDAGVQIRDSNVERPAATASSTGPPAVFTSSRSAPSHLDLRFRNFGSRCSARMWRSSSSKAFASVLDDLAFSTFSSHLRCIKHSSSIQALETNPRITTNASRLLIRDCINVSPHSSNTLFSEATCFDLKTHTIQSPAAHPAAHPYTSVLPGSMSRARGSRRRRWRLAHIAVKRVRAANTTRVGATNGTQQISA